MKKESKILAWHFVADDGKLGYGCGLEVAPGYVYSEPNGEIVICERGMHASRKAFDALQYAPGSVLCRVRVWGDVTEQNDKLVARHREVLEKRNVEKDLRLFACWCVRQVWSLLGDERSKKAVEVAEAFAEGKATQEELDAAWAAAEAAARAAAEAAAWAAAEAAAWAAAWAAAEAAAWAAAWAAAAGAEQSQEFERRILTLFGENE